MFPVAVPAAEIPSGLRQIIVPPELIETVDNVPFVVYILREVLLPQSRIPLDNTSTLPAIVADPIAISEVKLNIELLSIEKLS